MSDPVAEVRPEKMPPWAGRTLSAIGLVMLVAAVVPPIFVLARRYVWAQALQFSLLALGTPTLLVLSAQWRLLHMGVMDRLASSRARHRGFFRSASWLFFYMAAVIAWRTPAAVEGLRTYPWLVAVEAVSLVLTGVFLWLELADSPPLKARGARPLRMALAAFAMWTVWITAYLLGMAQGDIYTTYHASPGGLSIPADQEIAAFILWGAAGLAFVPLIFWNLFAWLASEEDPDRALDRVLKEEQRRAIGPQ